MLQKIGAQVIGEHGSTILAHDKTLVPVLSDIADQLFVSKFIIAVSSTSGDDFDTPGNGNAVSSGWRDRRR